jgi:NAD(P)-dependent dehydrogenase (short-subunit alcohol dehydrogenase family)
MFNLAEKSALVTGGGAGIGRACATALAMAGADVLIADINEDLGEKTAASIRQLGVKSLFVKCDVSSEKQIKAMVVAAAEGFGKLDIAVNNAGIGVVSEEDEKFPKSEWDKLMAVNLGGLWLCNKYQAQQMIKQTPSQGKIINIASIAGLVSLPISNGAYDASKSAVIHLTKQLALQWGRFNINVNSISPSYILTPQMAYTSLEFRKRVRETTPLGHMQRPEDLYGPILYLASQASDYMTGQNMVIDGGHTLGPWIEPAKAREVPPRVSIEQELAGMKKDLDVLGIAYDEDGVVLS